MFLTTDDNSREKLKNPGTLAESRISTLINARGRLETAFMSKMPQPVSEDQKDGEEQQTVPNKVAPIVTPTYNLAAAQPETISTDELDIEDIRRHIDELLPDEPLVPKIDRAA